MSAILEVNRVDQVYRTGFWMQKTQVLHGVSLRVPARSVCGFLGPNGAGKTTLIHLIIGVRAPTRGTVKLDGLDTTTLEARAKVGYLPERPYFHDHLTGEELLQYAGALSGMSRSRIQARIPKALSLVGLSAARKVELRKYSKGMLQRVGIAQAILHEPEFLVLDEPMSGLDPLGRKEMRELIQHLSGEGHTIFFSSHVIPDVEAICDQVAVIKKGKLVGSGPIGNFLAQGSLQTEIGFSGEVRLDELMKFRDVESVREMHGGFRAFVSGHEAVNSLLGKLMQRGCRILWVTPIRPSLEDLFEEKSR